MFNYGIFRKTLADSAWSIGMAAIGLVVFVILFVWAMMNMGAQVLDFVAEIPWIRTILEAGLGINFSGDVSLNTIFSVCFTHGVVLAITWTVMIATTTRVTVGEIERGTADMLLALPISRMSVYFSTTTVWILAAAILSFCPILGIWIGTNIFETEEVVEINRYIAPATNFLCLNVAIGSMSSMIAALLSRRGQTVGIVVAIAFVSAVINFLVPVFDMGNVRESIKSVRYISLLNYFRPVDIVRFGQWPLFEMSVLIAFAAACWLVGLVAFSRKDIPTA